jgi:hypothetical protein
MHIGLGEVHGPTRPRSARTHREPRHAQPASPSARWRTALTSGPELHARALQRWRPGLGSPATSGAFPEALEYKASRGLRHLELVDRFRLGFANRTLGLRLPEKNRLAGAALRGRLQELGILRASGHEHFNGVCSATITLVQFKQRVKWLADSDPRQPGRRLLDHERRTGEETQGRAGVVAIDHQQMPAGRGVIGSARPTGGRTTSRRGRRSRRAS